MNQLQNFTKGFIKDNPVFVLLLGLCPTLGVTTTAINGLGMGLATMFVLVMSNLVVSLIKNLIPDKVRIPSFIVIIASFVTIVELTMQAYTPALFEALGLFIPLIVVNCIVLGRAEAFASKNNIISIAPAATAVFKALTIKLHSDREASSGENSIRSKPCSRA